jgi:hypothetical protein
MLKVERNEGLTSVVANVKMSALFALTYKVTVLRETICTVGPVYIWKTLVMKTNSLHYLSLVYFVDQPLHVLGIFVAHHQEVYCIYTTIGTCCAF